jgi:hypothetical protein
MIPVDQLSLPRGLAAILRVAGLVFFLGHCALAKPVPPFRLQFFSSISEEEAKTRARVMDYSAQRAWLNTHDDDPAGWPKEYRRDLNGDGHPEVFLRVAWHAHFAKYSIFTKCGRKWTYIGACDFGGVPPVVLARARRGWRDFSVDIEGSRNRLDRQYFRFDPADKSYGLSYTIAIRREVTAEAEPE